MNPAGLVVSYLLLVSAGFYLLMCAFWATWLVLGPFKLYEWPETDSVQLQRLRFENGLDPFPEDSVTPQAYIGSNMETVYVCHPYTDDPVGNRVACQKIAADLFGLGKVAIAPQCYLPDFFDEDSEREVAMEVCLELLRRCDVLLQCTDRVTAGMAEELELAQELGIPVVSYAKVLGD